MVEKTARCAVFLNELCQSNEVALAYELLNSKAVQYELFAYGEYELWPTAI
jgi:hypothetical protein